MESIIHISKGLITRASVMTERSPIKISSAYMSNHKLDSSKIPNYKVIDILDRAAQKKHQLLGEMSGGAEAQDRFEKEELRIKQSALYLQPVEWSEIPENRESSEDARKNASLRIVGSLAHVEYTRHKLGKTLLPDSINVNSHDGELDLKIQRDLLFSSQRELKRKLEAHQDILLNRHPDIQQHRMGVLTQMSALYQEIQRAQHHFQRSLSFAQIKLREMVYSDIKVYENGVRRPVRSEKGEVSQAIGDIKRSIPGLLRVNYSFTPKKELLQPDKVKTTWDKVKETLVFASDEQILMIQKRLGIFQDKKGNYRVHPSSSFASALLLEDVVAVSKKTYLELLASEDAQTTQAAFKALQKMFRAENKLGNIFRNAIQPVVHQEFARDYSSILAPEVSRATMRRISHPLVMQTPVWL